MAGLLGFIKPRPVSVGAGDIDPGQLSGHDKLSMLIAALRDDQSGLQSIPLLAAARAAQARQGQTDRQFADAFSGTGGVPTLARRAAPQPEADPEPASGLNLSGVPRLPATPQVDQYDVTTTPGKPRADFRTLAAMLAANVSDPNFKNKKDLLELTKPDYDYVNGVRVEKHSGDGPREITALDKGQEHVYDASGRIVGVRNADGSIQAAADMAAAVTGAQERAKAGYDLVKLPDPDHPGAEITVPRLKGVEMTGGAPAGVPRVGGGTIDAPAPAAPGRPFRTQTPAEKTLTEGRATNQVKREGMVSEAQTQATLDLPKLKDQANHTLGVLAQIRRHPSLDDRTGNSTLLPAIRPQDVDFDVMVRQIGGGAFLEAVNTLRGTGQISEIEGAKATDAIARMQNQRQSKEGFLKAMDDYEGVVKAGLKRAENRSGGAAAGAGITPEQARAELARRRAARGGQ